MYQILIVMFLLIALGFFLRLIRFFSRDSATLLNRLVFYVTFPCLVFRSLQGAPLDVKLWSIPPLAYVCIGSIFLFSYFFASHLLKSPVKTSVSFAMGAAFGNTAFLGYPFVLAFAGERGLPPAIFFDQMGNFLAVYTVGILFCTYGKTGRFSLRNVSEMAKLPPFLAFFLAIAMNGISLPPFIEEALRRLADATVPLTMIAIGASLSGKHLSHNVKPLLWASFFKLFILPVSTLLFLRIVSLPTLYRQIMILQSATPALMSSYVLASLYELDTEFSASVILFTTLVSLLSLPLWGLFLQS